MEILAFSRKIEHGPDTAMLVRETGIYHAFLVVLETEAAAAGLGAGGIPAAPRRILSVIASAQASPIALPCSPTASSSTTTTTTTTSSSSSSSSPPGAGNGRQEIAKESGPCVSNMLLMCCYCVANVLLMCC